MNITKKLLTLLAIFCVIASAGAVCAADANADIDGTYLSAVDDMVGVGDHPDFDDIDDAYDGGWAGGQYNGNMEDGHPGAPEIDPDYAHDEAAGEPINASGNATNNLTANTTGNATAQAVQNQTANATSAHNMLATGNPILLLLGVTAVLGAGAVLRRK
ncbi:hypothetical protein [Methanobrevibacter sp.]|uniref:hypothetical protein n=1 Tax=Methanobrevibacter sp. TaxID=66852 RepID=UPI00388D17C6